MSGSDLFRGTLDLLILRVLASGPMHGFGIGRILRENSSGVLDVAEGVLYPALHRLDHRGLVAAEWQKTDSGRRARFYGLTPAGRRRLDELEAEWTRFHAAVAAIPPAGDGSPS